MLSRKVYEAHAAIIRRHMDGPARSLCYDMADELANYFEKDNPRFDRLRFFEACGFDGGLHFRPLPVAG
jgi:hypothetical protein